MAINPPSDIVLDVARAADPTRYQAAVEKLAKLSDASRSRGFSEVLGTVDESAASGGLRPEPVNGAVNLRGRLQAPEVRARDEGRGAFQQFEAFFLQNFVQMMLPRDASNVYGSGTAGEFWKSLLAENLGKSLAESGGVGIADRLLKERFEGSAATWASNLPSLDPRFPSLLRDVPVDGGGESVDGA
jgi:hypothetical protein